ncbi:MAG: ATP-binding protein [Streptosporangiaceae bacterium]
MIFVVAVLITVDIMRSSAEALVEQADWRAHDTGRSLAAARSVPGVHAFPRDPAVRNKPVPAAPGGVRAAVGPVEVDSFERSEQAARGLDPMRRDAPPPAGRDAQGDTLNALFMNMSRRSQALVERQIRLIESLEHGEQDRQRLASLSRLNRIAMRMHRNSQNLLVLAGQEPATGWNQPVTLANLVEAALSEIEEYDRVSFEVQPDIAVRGPAVHDAVHLLVELIENATSFSAADMPVHIKGQVLASGGALVDITDRGIGMPEKDMVYANQQLDNPPPPDFDIPKWMGLLVVARLAARHGIRVRLNRAELGGLTALVWLPDEILTHYGAAADPGYAATGQRAAVARSAAFAPARMTAPDVPAARPDPAWSVRSSQAMAQAEPATAVRAAAGRSHAPSGDASVVRPQAESQAPARGLPIFDEVESRWSRGGHEAPGTAGLAMAPGPAAAPGRPIPPTPGRPTASGPPATPGPAAGSPAVSGPAPGGLPRRPPAATQAQRAVPSPPPGAPRRPGTAGGDRPTGFQRGPAQGWAPPAEEADSAGPDEPYPVPPRPDA